MAPIGEIIIDLEEFDFDSLSDSDIKSYVSYLSQSCYEANEFEINNKRLLLKIPSSHFIGYEGGLDNDHRYRILIQLNQKSLESMKKMEAILSKKNPDIVITSTVTGQTVECYTSYTTKYHTNHNDRETHCFSVVNDILKKNIAVFVIKPKFEIFRYLNKIIRCNLIFDVMQVILA